MLKENLNLERKSLFNDVYSNVSITRYEKLCC